MLIFFKKSDQETAAAAYSSKGAEEKCKYCRSWMTKRSCSKGGKSSFEHDQAKKGKAKGKSINKHNASETTDLHLRPVSRILLSWSTRSTQPVSPYSFFPQSPCPNSSSFCSLLCIFCHILVHDELRASHFFFKKSFNVLPEYSVQLPFHFVTSGLGLVEIALHLFN